MNDLYERLTAAGPGGVVKVSEDEFAWLGLNPMPPEPKKVHIRLASRERDCEVYRLSIKGAPSQWQTVVSSACISAGAKWDQLARECQIYRSCLEYPAIAHA